MTRREECILKLRQFAIQGHGLADKGVDLGASEASTIRAQASVLDKLVAKFTAMSDDEWERTHPKRTWLRKQLDWFLFATGWVSSQRSER